MKKALARILMHLALRIWRTDLTFHQYPFGPPDHGIKYGFAWWAYHWSRPALSRRSPTCRLSAGSGRGNRRSLIHRRTVNAASCLIPGKVITGPKR